MDHAIPHSPNGAGHEHSEISVRTVVVSLIVLLTGTFMVCLLVVGIFRYFHTENKVAQTAKDWKQQIPAEPRVEEHPWEQLITVRAREDHVLSSYAWIDRKEGTVRIPIDQAIEKLAQQGLPSHDYLADIQAGKKPPVPKGSSNVVK
ncbi:MAG TPA: hypothetical protein VEU96_08485 [Bryobacteraceae bacterium]|nr:hypothetical protein [Bryobacteraceae bacterium]